MACAATFVFLSALPAQGGEQYGAGGQAYLQGQESVEGADPAGIGSNQPGQRSHQVGQGDLGSGSGSNPATHNSPANHDSSANHDNPVDDGDLVHRGSQATQPSPQSARPNPQSGEGSTQAPGEGQQSAADADRRGNPGRALRPGAGFRSAADLSARAASPHAPDLVPAVFATGGGGRFKDLIQWMQWANPADYEQGLPVAPVPTASTRPDGSRPDGVVIGVEGNGDGVPTERVINTYRDISDTGRLITTCRLSDLDFELNRRGRHEGHLVATIPGNWTGDTLDNLYNIGGAKGKQEGHPASGTVASHEQNPNQLVIGLANGQYNISSGPGYAATPRFKVACTATFWQRTATGAYTNPRNFPIDGMVIADAESAGYWPRSEEWIEVETRNNVAWHVLDTLRDTQKCPSSYSEPPDLGASQTATATFGLMQPAPAGFTKLRLAPNGAECRWGLGGPGIVMLAQHVSEATIAVQGDGVQAVAVGVIMPIDFGDAPLSYGAAAAFFHPDWTQAVHFETTNLYRGVGLSEPQAPAPRLGSALANHTQPVFDATAGLDFADDGLNRIEDVEIITEPGAQLQRHVQCEGPGLVAGWIDWDVNGRFDADEKSNEAECAEGVAALTWQVPADVKRAVNGEEGSAERTFMRVRIADPGETSFGQVTPLQPTGTTSTGEVEDYAVQVFVPTLELSVIVDNSEEWTTTPEPATTWRVLAQQGRSSDPLRDVAAQGHLELRPMPAGTYTLRTRGPGNRSVRGYAEDSVGWICRETPGTVRPFGQAFSAGTSGAKNTTLSLPKAERVTCTITYRPVFGELRWQKTDPAGTRLSGSEWSLEGPRVPAGTIIRDCDTFACTQGAGVYVDRDALPGGLYLRDLRWGEHRITEVRAPAGYVIGSDPVREATLAPFVSLGRIVNEQATPIALPLTGGDAADEYTIAGMVLLGASAVAGGVLVRRRWRARV